MKGIIFLGNSKDNLKEFPDEARREAGFQLSAVQAGLDPSDWKPMPTIGQGVREIHIRMGGAFRIIYLSSQPEGIYILHCFPTNRQTGHCVGPCTFQTDRMNHND